MLKKPKREHYKLHFQYIYVGFAILSGAILLAIGLLISSLIWPELFMTDAEKVELAMQRAVEQTTELYQKMAEEYRLKPATINQVIDESHFFVVYEEQGNLVRMTARDGSLDFSPNQDYHFNVSIEVGTKPAENVRVLANLPEYLVLNQPAIAEILIIADNASPYYENWVFTYDGESLIFKESENAEISSGGEEVAASPASSSASVSGNDLRETESSGSSGSLEQDSSDTPDEAIAPPACLKLTYEADSAVLHSNSAMDGTKLDYQQMTDPSQGALLGAESMDGKIPRGDAGISVVSWVIKTSPAAGIPSPSTEEEKSLLPIMGREEVKFQQNRTK